MPEINPCVKCGSAGVLFEPNYADDRDTFVVCEKECGMQSESFMFGVYREGSISAIEDWNKLEC